LHSDVLPCLQRLSSADVTLGVISDFDERLEGYSKPSKELWKIAIQRAGGADEAWHIGDDFKKDAFDEATTVILDRTNAITTAFHKISSLEELPELLRIP